MKNLEYINLEYVEKRHGCKDYPLGDVDVSNCLNLKTFYITIAIDNSFYLSNNINLKNYV